MARALFLAAALLILSIAASGCTVDVHDTRKEHAGPTDTSIHTSSTRNIVNGCELQTKSRSNSTKPIQIQETRDFAGPTAKTWNFTVDNAAYKSFEVRIVLRGPQGTGQFVTLGPAATLVYNGCTIAKGNGGTGINSGSNSRALDYASGGVGAFILRFDATGLGSYTASVNIQY